MLEPVQITKYKYGKSAPFSYNGRILDLSREQIVVEAFFALDDQSYDEVVIKKGDRFIETYFSRRWFNIYEIHDRDSDLLKCWYCNVAEPAVFEPGKIWFIDLELDLLVYPDGRKKIMDEDDFEARHFPSDLAYSARSALEVLINMKFIEWQKRKI
jgi:hypothetical protein